MEKSSIVPKVGQLIAELVFSPNLFASSLYHAALERNILHVLKEAKGFKIVHKTCEKKPHNIVLSVRSHPIEQMETLRLIKVVDE